MARPPLPEVNWQYESGKRSAPAGGAVVSGAAATSDGPSTATPVVAERRLELAVDRRRSRVEERAGGASREDLAHALADAAGALERLGRRARHRQETGLLRAEKRGDEAGFRAREEDHRVARYQAARREEPRVRRGAARELAIGEPLGNRVARVKGQAYAVGSARRPIADALGDARARSLIAAVYRLAGC